MTTIAMLGVWCTRFHRHRRDSTACEACPEGISSVIRLVAQDHRRPYPGDLSEGLLVGGGIGRGWGFLAGSVIHVIEQKSLRDRLEETDVYHCTLERARHQGGLHDLR